MRARLSILSLCFVISAILAINSSPANATEKRQARIGFFVGGEGLAHTALRVEFVKQLRIVAGDEFEIVTVPYGYRSASWHRDSSRIRAAELAADPRIDLMVTLGPWAPEDLLEAGFTKPIVALYRVDPALEGLLDSTGRPRAENLTVHARPDKIARDLSVIKRLANADKIGILYFHDEGDDGSLHRSVAALANRFSMEVITSEGFDRYNTFAFFRSYMSLDKDIDAVYILPTWGLDTDKLSQFFQMPQRDRIPSFVWESSFLVEKGACVSASPHDLVAEARFNAEKTLRILRGETPADLPILFEGSVSLTIDGPLAARCGVDLSGPMAREARIIGDLEPPSSAPYYSLSDAVERALDRNPAHLAEFDALEAAAQAVKQERSALLPRLEADYSITRYDDNAVHNSYDEIDQTRQAGRLTLNQTLFSLADRRAVRAAGERRNVRAIDLERSQLDLELAVTAAYLRCLRAEEEIDAHDRHRAEVERYSDFAATIDDLRDTATADPIRWRQERLTASARLARGKAELRGSRVGLNALINMPGGDPFILDSVRFSAQGFFPDFTSAGSLLADPRRARRIEDYLVTAALENNPNIVAWRRSIGLQQSLLAENRGRYYPTVTVEASVGHVDALADQPPEFYEEKTSWYVGGGITLPLWFGGERSHERSRLKAGLSELEYRRDDATLEVMEEVMARLRLLEASVDNVRRTLVATELAQQGLALVADDYEAGTRGLTELVDAQRNLLAARLEAIATRYEYHLTAARLLHAVGWSTYDASSSCPDLLYQNLSGVE